MFLVQGKSFRAGVPRWHSAGGISTLLEIAAHTCACGNHLGTPAPTDAGPFPSMRRQGVVETPLIYWMAETQTTKECLVSRCVPSGGPRVSCKTDCLIG